MRLQHAQVGGVGRQAVLADARLHGDDAGDLLEEPRVDLAHLRARPRARCRGGSPGRPCAAGPASACRARRGWRCGRPAPPPAVRPGISISSRPVRPVSKPAQRLLQRFLEGAADRHDLADRLHGRGQHRLGAGEFLEGEARDLGHDIVDRRLEGGRRGAAGDVVVELVQRVADGELGGDLGDREAGRLRRQGGGARHARVHLDDDQAAVCRVDGELHVGAAGLDADLAQHRDRGVAHHLVFLVGQGQRRRDGDRIAGVDAHRIDVLDRADDDAVVRLVADHLHLVFLPAEHALLDQHFGGRRGVEAALDDLEEFGAVVGDAAAGAADA